MEKNMPLLNNRNVPSVFCEYLNILWGLGNLVGRVTGLDDQGLGVRLWSGATDLSLLDNVSASPAVDTWSCLSRGKIKMA
jgi:hypothetical protein